jgi:hypothetical protein
MSKQSESEKNVVHGGTALVGGLTGVMGADVLGDMANDRMRSVGEEAVAAPGNALLRDKLEQHSNTPVFKSDKWLRDAGIGTHNAIALDQADIDKVRSSGWMEGLLHDKPHIIIGKNAPAHTLAHEMGHQQGGVPLSAIKSTQGLAGYAGLGGVASGALIDNPWLGLGLAAGVPALLHAPTLVDEGYASYKGYKTMKNLGASADELRHARKGLGAAMGAYLSGPLGNAAEGVGGWGVGRVGRGLYKKNESEKRDKTSSVADLQEALEKMAKTRGQREAIQALERGDVGTAGEIAKGYQQLGLSPRHLKDVSLGGGEAAVDLMMGVPQTAHPVDDTGMVVRKMYKPDSRLHQGERTRRTLELKQQMTDRARANPEMRPHMAAMGGFEEVNPGRFVSYHEHVPGQEIGKVDQNDMLRGLVDIQDKVVGPAKDRGDWLHDLTKRHTTVDFRGMPIRHDYGTVGGGAGNIVMAPNAGGGTTAKIIDFIPIQKGVPQEVGNPTWMHTLEQRAKGLDEAHSAWEGPNPTKDMGDLRREVFQGKGSRQAKKVRIGPAGIPGSAARAEEVAPGLLRRAGGFVAEHPLATGAAALGVLGGGYALHKHMKNKDKTSSVADLQEALEKISKSRWAEVMDETLSAAQDAWKSGDQVKAHQLVAEARQIGSTVGKAGVRLREIRPLGQGGEATAKLMAGDLVHQHAPGEGMAAVKFINPVHGVRTPDVFGGARPKDEEEALKLFRDYHLPQRVLENAVLPEALSAKNYGMFMQRSAKAGDVDAMRRGGVEMQQFMPFESPVSVAEQLGRTVKAHPKVQSYEQLYSSKKDKQRLWDVIENRDNVRLNDVGDPRVIDSRFDPLHSGTLVGRVGTPNGIGRDRFTHQAGADVLSSLREGENTSPGYGVVRVSPNLPPSYSPSGSSVREAPKAAVPPAPKVPAPAPHVPAPKRELVKTEVPAAPPPSVAGPSPDVSDEKFNGTDAAILTGLAVPPVAAGAYALHKHLKNKGENDNQEQKHMKNKGENDNQEQKAASVTWGAFFDEARKIAFDETSAKQMLTAARRGGTGLIRRAEGFSAFPAEQRFNGPVKKMLGTIEGLGVKPEVMEGIREATQAGRRELPFVHPTQNIIKTPASGDAVKFFRDATAGAPGSIAQDIEAVAANPSHRRMLDHVVKGHEVAELQSRPGLSAVRFGHVSPEVILREHNMLATMPKGNEPVRKLMQTLRGGGREQEAFLTPYGLTHGEGQRLSRHARKHIVRDIESRGLGGLRSQLAEMNALE